MEHTKEQLKALYEHLTKYIGDERLLLFKEKVNQRTKHFTLVLEDVYQSQNASALIRTADGLGIADIHAIEERNVYTPNKDITRGANKWIKINRYRQGEESTLNCIESIKKAGYKLAITSPHQNGFTPYNIPINEPLAICFGTEKEGVTPLLTENADYYIQIPMYGFTESFNVSVSAGIILSALSNRLRESNINWALNDEEKELIVLDWMRKTNHQMAVIERRFWEEQDLVPKF